MVPPAPRTGRAGICSPLWGSTSQPCHRGHYKPPDHVQGAGEYVVERRFAIVRKVGSGSKTGSGRDVVGTILTEPSWFNRIVSQVLFA
jgi:hypothetical protein